MVEVMLLSVWLVLVRLALGMPVWACSFIETPNINSPIDFEVRLLNSNDHAIAPAAQNIANKATGDAMGTAHSRSRCIELILATGPIQKSFDRVFVFQGPKITYKLYANTPINGILEYQYTVHNPGHWTCLFRHGDAVLCGVWD
jgi:hypothetical protein